MNVLPTKLRPVVCVRTLFRETQHQRLS